MNKFCVGDKVVLNRESFPLWCRFMDTEKSQPYGVIKNITFSGHCNIKWPNNLCYIYNLKDVEFYIGDYLDFFDKIKDRLG